MLYCLLLIVSRAYEGVTSYKLGQSERFKRDTCSAFYTETNCYILPYLKNGASSSKHCSQLSLLALATATWPPVQTNVVPLSPRC